MSEEEQATHEETIEELAEQVEEEREQDVEEIETDSHDRRSYEERQADLDLVEQDLTEEIEGEEPEGPEPDEIEEKKAVQEYPDFLNLKIDGETKKIESSKVWDAGIRSLQKESAADSRLEEASNLKREAQESLEKAKAESESIAPTPEQRAIVREISQKFEATYPELAGDEYLRNLTIMEANRRLAEGQANSWELYNESAKAVKSWHGRIASERVAKEQFNSKLEKKRAMASATVKGVNAKLETTIKEPPKETVSDVIAEMRKARKQFV